MSWRPNNVWLVLAIAIAAIAWQLTRMITHVDRTPRSVLTVTIDEPAATQFEGIPRDFAAVARLHHQFPEIALVGMADVLFLVTPATRSITVGKLDPAGISCRSLDEEEGGTTAFIVAAAKPERRNPIAIQSRDGGVFIPIPGRVRDALTARSDRRAGIACTLPHALATAPTFTERAVTLRVEMRPGAAVIVDVSALEDVDDLRFSGGIQSPLGGDRTRILTSRENIVSAEWADVTAQEQRDIVLVLIGALSAIAAAMFIEAMRPWIESRSKK